MKQTYPETRTVYHDSSLSAFATGLFIGTLATLILATDDGRKAGKKLLEALKDAGHDLQPEIEKYKPQISQVVDNFKENLSQNFNPLDNLHRTPPSTNASSSTFTQSGKPLR